MLQQKTAPDSTTATPVGAVGASQLERSIKPSNPPWKNPELNGAPHITPRVVEHLCKAGKPVRVMAPSPADEASSEFHPELFECRGRASEILAEAGLGWFSDYRSIDLLHAEYGLEICGIQQETKVEPVVDALRSGFPLALLGPMPERLRARTRLEVRHSHVSPSLRRGGRCVDEE